MSTRVTAVDLSGEEHAALVAALGELLPASADGKFSGADADRFLRTISAHALAAVVRPMLARLSALAASQNGRFDADLPPALRRSVIDGLRRKHARLFAEFFILAIQCYCLDPRVHEALGRRSRAPYPEGYVVPDGNLELLEPVYQRGPCYRQC